MTAEQRAGRRRSARLLNIIVFLFGLSLATDVVYVAIVGRTPVYAGYAFGLVLFLYFVVKDRARMRLSDVHKSVWAFLGIAAISLMMSLINVFVGLAPDEAPVVVLRGLIVLACGFCIYYVTVRLGTSTRYLLAGIAVGIVVNGVLSLLQQAAFDSGSYLSLYSLFPQEHFYIAAPFNIWGQLPPEASLTNLFRPQGLFLEASHLMAFLTCFAPLAFICFRGSIPRILVVGLTAYCGVMALSPNVVFLIAEVIILIALRPNANGAVAEKNETRSRRVGGVHVIGIIAAIFLVVLFLILNPGVVSSSLELLPSATEGLNVFTSTDTGTLERWEMMQKALGVVLYYPLGAGWNTESYILRFWFGNSDVTSLSYAIRLLIEIGIPGFVGYLWLIYTHSVPLLRRSGTYTGKAVGIAVVCLFVIQVTNGTSMIPWTWALLGLANSLRLGRLPLNTERDLLVKDGKRRSGTPNVTRPQAGGNTGSAGDYAR